MSDEVRSLPEEPVMSENIHTRPEQCLIVEERADFDLASESAGFYAMAWGFQDANDLKNWGERAEQERIADVSASRGARA